MKNLLFLFIFSFFCTLYPSKGFGASPNIHPRNWKNSELLNLLKTGKVISMHPMKEYLEQCGKKIEFDGEVFLVELDNGIKGVFKPYPLDDLGDGYAEVAAYEASILLGFPYIPPIIITELKGKKGSLQLFVETTLDPLIPEVYAAALKEASLEDLANLKLFYFIFGQWDSGSHNMLILKDQQKTYLIAIDNTGIRNHQHVKYGTLPFVRMLYSEALNTNDWTEPFPFEQAKTIHNPTVEKLRKVFGESLPKSFYKSFKSYGRLFRYVVYRNGLWKQYHAGDDSFTLSHTDYLPEQTKNQLQNLNIVFLEKIFSCANGADFLTPEYLNAILERRNQVLDYFDQKAKARRKQD